MRSEARAGGRRRPGPLDLLRTLLALGAIVPGILAGLCVWAVTRNRQRAMNRSYAVWARLGLAAAGVRLAVTGAEHLEAQRPAVFVLNHQSGIDPLLACALLRHDFVGVAKSELRRNPLLGPALALVGTVFLDRFDHARAVAQLAPALATLRRGISVAVTPEGTRSRGTAPGRFKKGAFQLALQARVPLVPVVLLNAADVLPRRAWLMTPATVRVVVHPPLATASWRPEELDERIAALERLYRDTLSACSAPG